MSAEGERFKLSKPCGSLGFKTSLNTANCGTACIAWKIIQERDIQVLLLLRGSLGSRDI